MKPLHLFFLAVAAVFVRFGCQESPEPVSREESPQQKPQYWTALMYIDSLTEVLGSMDTTWITIDSLIVGSKEYEHFLAQIEGPSSPAKSDYRVYEDHDESIKYLNEAGDEFSLDSLHFLRDSGVVFLLDTFDDPDYDISILREKLHNYNPSLEWSEPEILFSIDTGEDYWKDSSSLENDYLIYYDGRPVLTLRDSGLIITDSLAAIKACLLSLDQLTRSK